MYCTQVSKKATQVLRDGATSKTKTYSCVIWTATPPTDERLAMLDAQRDLVLHQVAATLCGNALGDVA